MIHRAMALSNETLPAPSLKTAADYCAYPIASMESAALALPDNLPPGVTLGEGP